ncbi:MAG: hypothetical protein WD471_00625 [Candidatus Paceibacterota bacterium]
MINSEKYIVLEENSSYFKRVDLRVDSIDSKIEVESIENINLTDKVRKQDFLADKVILALGSRKATTIENYFTIKRDNPENPINSSELDNLVFKGLWNFLDSYRGWSSDKMEISDLDMTLANIEILNIYIDSHNVVNPLGVKGKSFSIKVRGTFIPRDILSFFSEFKFFNKNLLIIEKSSAISSFLNDKEGLVVNCDDFETNIFKNSKSEVKFIKRSKWGLSNVIKKVSKLLSISSKESLLVMDKYFEDEVSSNFKKYLNDKLSKTFKDFQKIIESLPKGKKQVLINVPEPILSQINIKGVKVKHIDFESILNSKGFNVIIKDKESIIKSANKDYLALMGFCLFSSPHNESLNSILQRRSKWLVPNNKQ